MKNKNLLLCLLLLWVSITTYAYDACIDGIYYNLSGTTASVTYETTSYNSYSGAVVIPESVEYNGTTYRVTSIGDYAFFCCSDLTSVTIPNSVTSIGNKAFDTMPQFSKLTKAEFSSIEHLCNISFGDEGSNPLLYANHLYINGEEIKEVIIPEGILSIGNYTFYGCSGLTSVILPNSVTSIGDKAFCNCSGLTSINIPNSVTSIGDKAFFGCSDLTSVTIPNSVTSIGDKAFCNCSGLTSVVSNINTPFSFGLEAFSNLSISCTLTVPSGTREAYINAGWTTSVFCGGIIDLSNPGTIYLATGDYFIAQTLEGLDMSFKVMDNTQNIVQVVSRKVGLAAIDTNVKGTVTIPQKITYGGKEYTITSIGHLALGCCSGLTSVIIPGSVTLIDERAFYECSGLISINIPNSVTSIGLETFVRCSGLTSINIPNSVTSIGEGAFAVCSGLTSVTIPNSVTSIGNYAFAYCSGLTSVTIPNSVTSIGEGAFRNCI